jgi:hypothetical protein
MNVGRVALLILTHSHQTNLRYSVLRVGSSPIAFNIKRTESVVDYEIAEEVARTRGIAIRGGCFCSPRRGRACLSHRRRASA